MIRLHNSKTRVKEEFTPIDPNNVRMYVCGPTVYDRAHLGNGRPVVVFDVLFRLLRHVYGEGHVTYVRNFTDVDDKINATALARKAAGDPRSLEALIHERTEETIGWYHADMDALGALRPTHEPRATEYIGAMVAMIEDLIAKGHAYAKEGHALFRVRSYKDYGALSGRSVDDMIAGARVEVAPFKEDPMDFVLWKPSSGDEPGWDSPWGRGRPGWHIECSAMADDLLWQKPKKDGQLSNAGLQHPHSFDIHGGGLDLQFPHHENEIAQSCCAHATEDDPLGRSKFAQYWMHNEMLQVEGKKMSKSLGNFFTVRDLLDQGVPGEVIRFVYLSTHYSKPMDWTSTKAQQALEALSGFLGLVTKAVKAGEIDRPVTAADIDPLIIEAVADDLNTSQAITVLHKLAREKQAITLLASLNFLGFDFSTIDAYWEGNDASVALTALGAELSRLREEAMVTKDFAKVDELKAALTMAGIEVRMSKAGVELFPAPNFDPTKLEALK
ncbi:MAG: cysteinyl-tRNA synthetase [Rhodobacteraceae bacterium]|uniref:cysteine--tRNA ligase n=1 Tax=Cypionkella sp. TaxID=2811411 RepID=UPI00132073B0|nr:cysteine--tRNA ligase [Cypionkella sp.]KAF0170895.1 MAG: cysteinyl-tRNA synthetase [Paracoccaceae bacterium]MDO8328219.1 cysteine--tRNA ligase [Cypionkella sp.]